jgi:hypothetical protein
MKRSYLINIVESAWYFFSLALRETTARAGLAGAMNDGNFRHSPEEVSALGLYQLSHHCRGRSKMNAPAQSPSLSVQTVLGVKPEGATQCVKPIVSLACEG